MLQALFLFLLSPLVVADATRRMRVQNNPLCSELELGTAFTFDPLSALNLGWRGEPVRAGQFGMIRLSRILSEPNVSAFEPSYGRGVFLTINFFIFWMFMIVFPRCFDAC